MVAVIVAFPFYREKSVITSILIKINVDEDGSTNYVFMLTKPKKKPLQIGSTFINVKAFFKYQNLML